MTGKIIHLNNFRSIHISDLIEIEKNIWDAKITINNVPFLTKKIEIFKIEKEKMHIRFESLEHDSNSEIEKCIFCGQTMNNEVCPKISIEADELFYSKIIPEVNEKYSLVEMALSSYKYDEPMLINENEKVEVKMAGISMEGHMLMIVVYRNEEIMVKQYLGERKDTDFPKIMFEGESGEVLLHMEYMMQEHLFTILDTVNKFLKKENEIFDITEFNEEGFFQFYRSENNEKK